MEKIGLVTPTCAAGLHWLKRDQLFSEVKRVLRHRGAFAAYTYNYPQVANPIANQHLHEVS